MALAFVPALGRVLLSSGWCRSELVAVTEARWVVSVEKQSRAEQSKAGEVGKWLKSRGLGLFAGTEAGTGSPWGLLEERSGLGLSR